MLERHAITRRANADDVDALVAERDYVLAHVVAQLNHAKSDSGHLIFKGGTALRMVHLDGYRYSADLDFTVLGMSLEAAVTGLTDAIQNARGFAGFPHLELVAEKALSLEYVGPLGAPKPRRIKVDLSCDEYVDSYEQRTILPLWSDLPEPLPFDVYSIGEVTAEKLRCIIQRVQCRDLYDLFRLSSDTDVSLAEVRSVFEEKTRAKGIDPSIFPTSFDDRLRRYARRWDDEMQQHLANPPHFDDVVRAVRRHLRTADLIAP